MFEVMARLKVRDGQLNGFKEQALEMIRQTRERDTKTLRYDWFLSADGTECEVREAYVDADALITHAHHVAEAEHLLLTHERVEVAVGVDVGDEEVERVRPEVHGCHAHNDQG